MRVRCLTIFGAIIMGMGASALNSTGVELKTDRFHFQDHGIPRDFVLARDEILFQDRHAGGVFVKFRYPNGGLDAFESRRFSRVAKEAGFLILYEEGQTRNEVHRRYVTHKLLLRLSEDADPLTVAHETGLTFLRQTPDDRNLFLFAASDSREALALSETLSGRADVISAQPLLAVKHFSRTLPNDPLVSNQWHLKNSSSFGIHVEDVWDSGYTGTGIVIGIVDSGVEYTHPDLAPLYRTDLDWDFNEDTTPGADPGEDDPSPSFSWEEHGTAVMGIAGAKGDNNEGGASVAYNASLAGLRVNGTPISDQNDGGSMEFRSDEIWVKNYSWGPSDNGKTLAGPGEFAAPALRNSALFGRNGLGTIHVWAGGNGKGNGDNANYDGYANSMYTIAVAALTSTGTQASFSEPGACLVVTAPTSLLTTDRQGSEGYTSTDYYSSFTGTSASAPVVAGVAALILEANPDLGWRDVQEILIKTATQIDSSDSDWQINGAGYHFNHKYGAGLVHAKNAVDEATTWTDLPPQFGVSGTINTVETIPDNDPAGIDRTFSSGTSFRVEHVTVQVDIDHNNRGDLAISLTSPSGTVSRLAELHGDTNNDYSNWTFMTVFNWGEDSVGDWTVNIADLRSGTTGTLNSVTLTLHGSSYETDEYNVTEGGSFAATDVDGTATPGDPSDDGVLADNAAGLTLTLADPPSFHNGTFTLNSNGTFSYDHDGSEPPTDFFVYELDDGTNSTYETAIIHVAGVNDVPVAVADNISMLEGGTATALVEGPGFASVLANDIDPDSTLTATLQSSPVHASSFTFNSDGTFSYTHDGSETTSDSFSYQVSDPLVAGNTVTVSIDIIPVNDIPVTGSESLVVDEGGTVTTLEGGSTSVLDNDSDVESPTLTAVLANGPDHAAGFTLNPDGTFSYTHDGSETTSDSFAYYANDGTDNSPARTVPITINPINDIPIAVADTISVLEGGTATSLVQGPGNTSVMDNDIDPDSVITATLLSNPVHASSFSFNSDGTFSYTHDGGETTSDSFTYKVSDQEGDSNTATVTINITPVNDIPVAGNDSIVVDEGATATTLEGGNTSVLDNDSDIETASLVAVLSAGPDHAASFTLNSNGTFSYEHDGSETTSDSFTYYANDGTDNSNLATVQITINTSNDTPTTTGFPDQYFTEDAVQKVIDLTFYFDDEEDGAEGLTYTLEGGFDSGLFSSVDITGSTLTLDHASSAVGSNDLTIRATDSGNEFVEATLTVVFNTMQEWRHQYFSDTDLDDRNKEADVWGDNADPDKDGRENLLEYGLGFNPIIPDFDDARLSTELVPDGNDFHLSISFYERTNDSFLQFVPQVSSDGVTWLGPDDPGSPLVEAAGSPAAVNSTFDQATWEDMTNVQTGAPRYIQLKVINTAQ